MAVNLNRYWYLAFTDDVNSPVYIAPSKSMSKFCRQMASANPKLQTRPATWSDLKRFLNVILPNGVKPADRAKGILTFKRERRLISIWPL